MSMCLRILHYGAVPIAEKITGVTNAGPHSISCAVCPFRSLWTDLVVLVLIFFPQPETAWSVRTQTSALGAPA